MPAWRRATLGTILLTICLWPAAPAMAQLAGSLSLDSDFRFRGVSLSDGRPVLSVNGSYDHDSGAYAGASLLVEESPHSGVVLLGHTEYAGFAERTGAGPTLDVGVSHSDYSEYGYRPYGFGYTEVYAGVSSGGVSARVYYSPDYFADGAQTLYAELNGAVTPSSDWRLFGHIGALTPLAGWSGRRRERYDLRLGVARQFSRAELRVALTTATPETPRPGVRRQGSTAVVVGGSLFF